MHDVLADEPGAEEVAPPVVGDPPPDGEGLQGYNPSEGDPPLEAQAEAAGPGEEEEEPETFPEDPDDTPAGPDPAEEEYEPAAEEQTIVEESVSEPEPGLEPPDPAPEPEVVEEPQATPEQIAEMVAGEGAEVQADEEELATSWAETPKPKSKSRVYLVFEEHGRSEPSYKQVPECLYTGAEQIKMKEAHADDPEYEVPTGELRSRNGDNARRAAYRRLAAARENEDLRVTLVIVAESSWRPTPIKPRQRNLPPALEIG